MTFAGKLKSLRKQTGYSQEKLAEKLGVSRQAITKWETDAGTPEIENVIAISTLFGISLDELLMGEKAQAAPQDHLFESVTEYDIDHAKRYDIKLGSARHVRVAGHDGEKIRVRLASNQLSSLASDLKVRLDGERDRMDVDVSRKNGLTEATLKEALYISILLPNKYIHHIELNVNAEAIELSHLVCEQIELDVKAHKLTAEHIDTSLEINCDLDMDVVCHSLKGSVEINQISATSRLTLPQGSAFRASVKGIGNSISYEQNGRPCADLSDANAENVIKLNGMKSELIIAAESAE